MSALEGRAGVALIVDVQNGVVDGVYRRDEVVANIVRLVDVARSQRLPVIWVQHDDDNLLRGSHDWEYVPELAALPAEPVVHKHYGDAFEGTALETILAARSVGHVLVAGAETDACIRSTLHGAFVRGYDVTLVADAHTAGDKIQWGAPPVEAVIAHTNRYWRFQRAQGKQGAVLAASEAVDWLNTVSR
ncbi:isochorismatase family protein [Uruburuella testudinis]|uniref:Isochorismatase family protein n=1 Tax=Uruburuella testudinis TaxID=1282863 RepID=A0ABY4DS44_9NEIS|nr:isochorismatase family protein [Uruburuella testudinis]UOO81858.1 isochorismatase family protein [Uruburuella testudinis]